MHERHERARAACAREHGLTLIETVAAIIVGLIVIAGAVTLFGAGMSGSKTARASQDVAALVSGISALYSGAAADYSGLTNVVALQAGAVPHDMVTDTGIVDPWGGSVTIAGGGASWTLTLTELPSDACTTLAREAQGAASVTANGTTTAGASIDPPPPATVAASACAAAPATVVWTFTG